MTEEEFLESYELKLEYLYVIAKYDEELNSYMIPAVTIVAAGVGDEWMVGKKVLISSSESNSQLGRDGEHFIIHRKNIVAFIDKKVADGSTT